MGMVLVLKRTLSRTPKGRLFGWFYVIKSLQKAYLWGSWILTCCFFSMLVCSRNNSLASRITLFAGRWALSAFCSMLVSFARPKHIIFRLSVIPEGFIIRFLVLQRSKYLYMSWICLKNLDKTKNKCPPKGALVRSKKNIGKKAKPGCLRLLLFSCF